MSREQQESLDRGIDLFNERRFFEAHEEWEEEWRLMPEGAERNFFQGLIMAAASFYHYVQCECSGAVELLKRSVAFLKAGIEAHPELGVDEFVGNLETLRPRFEACAFGPAVRDLPVIRRNLVNRQG